MNKNFLAILVAALAGTTGCAPEMDSAAVLRQAWSLVLEERWGASLSLTYPEICDHKAFFVSSPADAPPA